MVRVFVRELRSSRVEVETEYGESDPHMRAERYLWHTIRYHILITEFREACFNCHTSMAHSVANHLFEHRVVKINVGIHRTKIWGEDNILTKQGKT